VNNTERVKKLESKKAYLQSKLSSCLKENKYYMSRKKLRYLQLLKQVFFRLKCIRKDYMCQSVNQLVKLKPCQVCIEDLDIIDMRDIEDLREQLENVALYKLLRQLERKFSEQGTRVIKANKTFASTRTCSRCGYINAKLPISQREFVCCSCNFTLDRDTNAAYNLLNYS
jgi:putative transposase